MQGYRRTLLGRDLPLIGIAGLSLANGTSLSPIFDSIFYYLDTFARGAPLYSPQLYFHLASVLISTLTALIAGIPAAIYERIRGLRESTPVSLGIWLVATALISLPAIMILIGDD